VRVRPPSALTSFVRRSGAKKRAQERGLTLGSNQWFDRWIEPAAPAPPAGEADVESSPPSSRAAVGLDEGGISAPAIEPGNLLDSSGRFAVAPPSRGWAAEPEAAEEGEPPSLREILPLWVPVSDLSAQDSASELDRLEAIVPSWVRVRGTKP
jgi:hypothetical protein